MEVLGICVPHEVWFLMELIAIEILNTNTDFSTLLNVEPEGHESNVWMDKSHDVRDLDLELISWVEQ